MPFADDLTLSELFFQDDFLGPLTQFLDPRQSFPDDPGVQPLTPTQIQEIRQHRNQKVKRLIKLWLDALPGPPVEAEQKFGWTDRTQHSLSEWLQPRWAAESKGTPPGIPDLCIAALRQFPSLKSEVLKRVPEKQRDHYRDSLPALAVRWIVQDAERAWKIRAVADAIQPFKGASVRIVLLLSFMPTEVFPTLPTRELLQSNRSQWDRRIKRLLNPRTKLSRLDPLEQAALRHCRAETPLPSHISDEDLKQVLAKSFRQLSLRRERELWKSIGLNNTPNVVSSRQNLWHSVRPLLKYLEPFAPSYKVDSPVTPDSLFRYTSQLFAARYPLHWEDHPDRLKSRWGYALLQ